MRVRGLYDAADAAFVEQHIQPPRRGVGVKIIALMFMLLPATAFLALQWHVAAALFALFGVLVLVRLPPPPAPTVDGVALDLTLQGDVLSVGNLQARASQVTIEEHPEHLVLATVPYPGTRALLPRRLLADDDERVLRDAVARPRSAASASQELPVLQHARAEDGLVVSFAWTETERAGPLELPPTVTKPADEFGLVAATLLVGGALVILVVPWLAALTWLSVLAQLTLFISVFVWLASKGETRAERVPHLPEGDQIFAICAFGVLSGSPDVLAYISWRAVAGWCRTDETLAVRVTGGAQPVAMPTRALPEGIDARGFIQRAEALQHAAIAAADSIEGGPASPSEAEA